WTGGRTLDGTVELLADTFVSERTLTEGLGGSGPHGSHNFGLRLPFSSCLVGGGAPAGLVTKIGLCLPRVPVTRLHRLGESLSWRKHGLCYSQRIKCKINFFHAMPSYARGVEEVICKSMI